MTIRVLVVDDSSFFRRRVSEILAQDPQLEVIDTAANGREAIDKVKTLRPDVITMDIEMPVMDGITAVREIMKATPTPVLMFSSLTHEGARATLEALEAGALDFLPKRFEDIARSKEEAIQQLQQRVRAIARRRPGALSPRPSSVLSSLSSRSMPARSPAPALSRFNRTEPAPAVPAATERRSLPGAAARATSCWPSAPPPGGRWRCRRCSPNCRPIFPIPSC